MRLIPKCFYAAPLLKLIDSYIESGSTTYNDLCDSDKEIITAQCIAILGDDAYSCIIDTDNFHKVLTYFTKYLRTADKQDSYDLVETMAKNATEYFAEHMDALFAERCNDRFLERMYDHGMRAVVDRTNGETIWRKAV